MATDDYFNPSLKELEVAKARRPRVVPTLAQIHATIDAMPASTAIEMRNRALVAFAILTGARDNAIASLKLRHIDLNDSVVHLDGRDVRTKFSKSFETWFFPVGANLEAIFRDLINHLVSVLGFGPDDPLFPLTLTGFDQAGLPATPSLSRECWSTATPIRIIFREAFALVGLPYFHPHSFRSTIARFGTSLRLTPEGLVSWSQNLGHADVLTTLTSYGSVPSHRQRELIIGARAPDEDNERLVNLGRMAELANRGTLRGKEQK